MKQNILPAIKLTVVCIIFFIGIYPLFIWGIARVAPGNGRGETVEANGKVVGYKLIGQKFTDDRYFCGRPSAVDYNAAGSGGSNKGPTNPDYLAQVQARLDTFLAHNPGVQKSAIPSDIVTASGSGLDPDISVQAAMVQIQRIAKLRGIAAPNLEQLILSNTEKPIAGLFGTEYVNVLKLNIALDNLK